VSRRDRRWLLGFAALAAIALPLIINALLVYRDVVSMGRR
jgi:hypothetical protein